MVDNENSFSAWLSRVGLEEIPELSFNAKLLDGDTREWFSSQYNAHGPMQPSQIAVLARQRLREVAERALALVSDDIRATNRTGPRFEIGEHGSALYVNIANGSEWYISDHMLSILSSDGMAVQMAEFVQDYLLEYSGEAWPVCLEHDRLIMANLEPSSPSWKCTANGHLVGAIGALQATKVR